MGFERDSELPLCIVQKKSSPRLFKPHSNAGIAQSYTGPLQDHPSSHYKQTMAVNSEGVYLGIKYAARSMQKRSKEIKESASIVNVSSVAGLAGNAGPFECGLFVAREAQLVTVKVPFFVDSRKTNAYRHHVQTRRRRRHKMGMHQPRPTQHPRQLGPSWTHRCVFDRPLGSSRKSDPGLLIFA